MNEVLREPYRLMFPLGIAAAIWGVSLWLMYGMTNSPYPGVLHSYVMIGAFLGCFAFGFLMTAVPRFTRSFPATRAELIPIATAFAILPLLAENNVWVLADLAFAYSVLIAFLVKRFVNRNAEPPPPFVLIAFGILSGWIGILILASGVTAGGLQTFGRLLFLHGFISFLIFGIGCRLIPMLEGRTPDFSATPSGSRNPFLWFGVLLLVTYALEAFLSLEIGRAARALLISWIAVNSWQIFRLPVQRSKLAWTIWASTWFVTVGMWGGALAPQYYLHFMHLAFVGGFGLMTLMVATRVVLAHGGHDLALEWKMRSLWGVGALVLGASLTRLIAGLVPEAYVSHLMYAAVLWITGVALWSFTVGKRLIFTGGANKHC